MPRHGRKKSHKLRAFGVIVLVGLLIICGIMAVPLFDLAGDVRREMNLTPTPVPVMNSVMSITPEPGITMPGILYKSGSQGDEVAKIQERLAQLGFYSGQVDGRFGTGTRAAVIAFQHQHGLDADGVAGPVTLETLYSSAANRAVVTFTPIPSPSPTPVPTQDSRLPFIVSKAYPVGSEYQPDDLVRIEDYCAADLVSVKYEGTLANREAVLNLAAMFRKAKEDGVTNWQISSAYRTFQQQKELFDAQVADYIRGNLSRDQAVSAARQVVADPGASEHITGLALDITVPGKSFKGTEQARWLAAHCWEYGFIIRYEEDKQPITGFLAEPWHIRYVGTEHSIPMRDKGFCLEEYISYRSGRE